MRNSIVKAGLLVASVCFAPGLAAADSYVCAVAEVFECEPVEGCKRTDRDEINLSAFIVVDTDKKQLTSGDMGKPSRTEDIEGMTVTEKAVFLHGTQDVETWNGVISLETGKLSGGISNADSSFAVFGNCTKK